MKSLAAAVTLLLLPSLAIAGPLRPRGSALGPLMPLPLSGIRLQGEIGRRYTDTIENRLLFLEVDSLVGCFESKSCVGSWDGEYVGKWLDAAALAYSATRDQRLLKRMDIVVARLLATQDADGYLGTYPLGKRFAFEGVYTSDVWVHRYVLLGLLQYYEVTKDAAAWSAMTRAADLILDTFGDAPGKRDLLATGFHEGLAATAIMEPIARIYARSRDPRYLEFCKLIVRAWESPRGPKLLSHLLERRPIQDLAGGKAYEILANLVGLVELYDVSRDPELLKAATIGWEDVARNQLYITGGSSRFERFQAPGVRPFSTEDRIQENCVTVTWMRLNRRLLEVTGDARFADAYLWSAYNQLLASQGRDSSKWCYYCSLAGQKPYVPYLTCCSSSGPRGIMWFAESSVMAAPEGPAVVLYTPGTFPFETPGGQRATLRVLGDFPFDDRVQIELDLASPERFSIFFLSPSWADRAKVRVRGEEARRLSLGPSFVEARQLWKPGDRIAINFRFRATRLDLGQAHPGLGAIAFGPMVLAYDAAVNPGHQGFESLAVTLSSARIDRLRAEDRSGTGLLGPRFTLPFGRESKNDRTSIVLRPWSMAGDTGAYARVLLPERSPLTNEQPWSLLSFWSTPSQSVEGNVSGSFNDGSTSTYSVTFTGDLHGEAWFALEAPRPVRFSRVTFCHGLTFHDGGWFDASAGPPRFEIRRSPEGAWEDLAAVAGYPPSTNTDPSTLVSGQCFSTEVTPTTAVGLRVIGIPASGDNPRQSFASCAELQAWP